MFAAPGSAQVRAENPNLLGGEVLGRGLLFTANYERYLNNEVGIGAGLMLLDDLGPSVIVVPVYISLLSGDAHALYTSAGAAFVGGDGEPDSGVIAELAIGYQYQSYEGFLIRPLAMLAIGSEGPGFWPGITIGMSF